MEANVNYDRVSVGEKNVRHEAGNIYTYGNNYNSLSNN